MVVSPKTVSVDLRAIADDAATIAECAERLDALAEWLRDLGDPRVSPPQPARLFELAREWASDLEQASEDICSAAEGIALEAGTALEELGC